MSAPTDRSTGFDAGSPSSGRVLERVVERARAKAARWRAAGAGEGLESAVHPPARSALLSTYLSGYLSADIEIPAPPSSPKERLLHMILAAERARIDRLFSYAYLLTEDLSKTICRLEVELAELRYRVGRLEEGGSVASPDPTPSEPARGGPARSEPAPT